MLSICLSVMLVDHDHISQKSGKLIACTISPTSWLFVAQRPSTYSQRNMAKFWGDYRWDGKSGCWSTKAAISLKHIKIEEKLLWRAYRNSPTIFRMVPSMTPMASPSQDWGFATPTQNCNRYYLRNGQSYELQI